MAPDLTPKLLRGRILVATDFDGTLAPIVSDPSQARAGSDAVEALRRLSVLPRLALAVVSGRRLPELDILCGEFPACWKVGDHGRSLQKPCGNILTGTASIIDAPSLDPVFHLAKEISLRWEGLSVERKDHGVALHFRNASPNSRDEAVEAIESWARDARDSGLQAMRGREVVEVQIPGEGKLSAIRRIARIERCDFVLFAGDDTTDIEAVRFLSGSSDGYGVWVRSPERPAPEFPPDLVVDGPSGWASFLNDLANHLETTA